MQRWTLGIVSLLACSMAACDASPSAPITTAPSQTTSQSTAQNTSPQDVVTVPPLSGPVRTFVYDHALVSPVNAYTTQSRVLLYDDGAFSIDGTVGLYTANTNGTLRLQFNDRDGLGAWEGTGTLTGITLTVQYNFPASFAGFDDAVYTLQP